MNCVYNLEQHMELWVGRVSAKQKKLLRWSDLNVSRLLSGALMKSSGVMRACASFGIKSHFSAGLINVFKTKLISG